MAAVFTMFGVSWSDCFSFLFETGLLGVQHYTYLSMVNNEKLTYKHYTSSSCAFCPWKVGSYGPPTSCSRSFHSAPAQTQSSSCLFFFIQHTTQGAHSSILLNILEIKNGRLLVGFNVIYLKIRKFW